MWQVGVAFGVWAKVKKLNRTIFFAAVFLGSIPAYADIAVLSEEPPNNVQLYETYGPSEYNRLEEGLYLIGGKISKRDADEICTLLKNGCKQETDIWQLDEFPGVHILIDHNGADIIAISFERRGFLLDRFEIGFDGVEIRYDGLPFSAFSDCSKQYNWLNSNFSFGKKYVHLSSRVSLAPCELVGRKEWSSKALTRDSEDGIVTYEIEYSVNQVDK